MSAQRISVIRGDRLCTGCGFNLYGQQVSRDEGTGLLLARCPECGTAAALQEYPGPFRALKWISGALIAQWLLMNLILILGTAGVMTGAATAFREVTVEETAGEVGRRHRAWFVQEKQLAVLQAEVAAGTAQQVTLQRLTSDLQSAPAQWSMVSDAWWGKQDQRSMIRYPWSGDRGNALRVAIIAGVFALAIGVAGVVLATSMPGLRGARFVVVALATFAISGVVFTLFAMGSSFRGWGPAQGFSTGAELSYDLVPLWHGWALTGLMSGVLLMTMLAGRRVSRWVVRGVLPERMARQLHVLWEADGVEFTNKQMGK